ncbi:MAG TPA: FlgD immunoglobulin-like domain containing protein [Stellaceae bacterium]|nr:FlgD immunoglobulin-like domain containing protein [Stellaceae bacterium]
MLSSQASSVMPATVTSLPNGDQLPKSAQNNQATNAQLNENNFFQLLTAQLENQDPLNPMSASDFAAELAQFSTAIGVQQLQSTQQSYGNLQLSGLVGKNVAVAGNALVLGSGGTATGAYNLSGPASAVTVTVGDAQGNLLQVLNLGPQQAGTQSFTWNGLAADGSTLPAGTYQFGIAAAGVKGANVTATAYSVVPVTGVTLGGSNGPTVDLGAGLAPVGMSDIQQVF